MSSYVPYMGTTEDNTEREREREYVCENFSIQLFTLFFSQFKLKRSYEYDELVAFAKDDIFFPRIRNVLKHFLGVLSLHSREQFYSHEKQFHV